LTTYCESECIERQSEQKPPNFIRLIRDVRQMKIIIRSKGNFTTWKMSLVGVVFAMLIISLPAFAELGGDEASVETDQVHMEGMRRIARAPAYSVHEIQAPTGSVVREYVSPAGKVFAVAWEGPVLPDLQQVLGPYFDRLAHARNNRNGRGPLVIHEPGLVVHSGGHMRAFVGRAYLPDMLPAGVEVESIH